MLITMLLFRSFIFLISIGLVLCVPSLVTSAKFLKIYQEFFWPFIGISRLRNTNCFQDVQ